MPNVFDPVTNEKAAQLLLSAVHAVLNETREHSHDTQTQLAHMATPQHDGDAEQVLHIATIPLDQAIKQAAEDAPRKKKKFLPGQVCTVGSLIASIY
jgi:hypothetical protein